MRKRKVLFLCTQNSARSQMAEAFLRHHAGDRFEAYSAGCTPTDEIHPYAVEAMDEVGIDIGDQYPKGLRTYMGSFPKDKVKRQEANLHHFLPEEWCKLALLYLYDHRCN